MDKKRAVRAGTAGTKNMNTQVYYRRRDRWSRKYRRGMASETMREAHRRMLGPTRTEGVASDYIEYLPDMIERGEVTALVLYARVSTQVQERNGSLSDQMQKLKELVQPYHIPVVARFCGVESGKNPNRRKLRRAVPMAQRENAVMVVDTTDRLIRAEDYDPHDRATWKYRPADAEYQRFMEANSGVVFATIGQHPDAKPSAARGHQTKRGHEAKGDKGGRPKKLTRAKRKDLLLPQVIQMKQDTGRGCCWIAEQVGLSSKTVWEWLKEVA